jgi:hypothetical protein
MRMAERAQETRRRAVVDPRPARSTAARRKWYPGVVAVRYDGPWKSKWGQSAARARMVFSWKLIWSPN